MNKKKMPIVGIDVSKDTFNAYYSGRDFKYPNSPKGWKKLYSEAPTGSLFAMEVTGNYHYRLASYLYSKGCRVKVLNALRFSNWLKFTGRSKAYTDILCARYLADYADDDRVKALPCWEPLSPKLARCKIILTLLYRLSKLSRQAGNVNHAASGIISGNDDLLGVMNGFEDYCSEQKKKLEKELVSLVSALFPEQFKLLQTIPGFGAKTAAVMLVSCRGIENFDSSAKLSAYLGFGVKVKDSGTSVHDKGRTDKVGNPYFRSLLFMCAMTAKGLNKPCAELYSRLTGKGKNGMLALTAVMHRLVKIAFGVVMSGEPYRGGKVALT